MKKQINIYFVIALLTMFFSLSFTSCGTVDEPICGKCTTQVTTISFQGRVVATSRQTNEVEACGDEFSNTAAFIDVQINGDSVSRTKYEDCVGN